MASDFHGTPIRLALTSYKKGKRITDCWKDQKACGPRDKAGNLLGVVCKGKGDSTYEKTKGICGAFVCLNHRLVREVKESKG